MLSMKQMDFIIISVSGSLIYLYSSVVLMVVLAKPLTKPAMTLFSIFYFAFVNYIIRNLWQKWNFIPWSLVFELWKFWFGSSLDHNSPKIQMKMKADKSDGTPCWFSLHGGKKKKKKWGGKGTWFLSFS